MNVPARLALVAVLSAVAAPVSQAAAICIRGYDIDHTDIPNDSTIMFYMKGGTVYKNALPQRCVGLKTSTRGFSYEPTDPGTDEICSNLMTFKVNDAPGETCLLGAFEKVAGK